MKNILIAIAFSLLLVSPVQAKTLADMIAEETFKDASERLYEAFHFIINNSIEEIDEEEMVDELIEVMLENLDINSVFMDPEASQRSSDRLGLTNSKKYVTLIPVGDYLYIRIDIFSKGVAKQLVNGFFMLDEMPKGIVLDLRDNPGGWLIEAIEVVNMFIDKGLIVEQRGRIITKKTNATQDMIISKNIPMVILIDGDTASAAEVVASALKDHNRAILLGRTTYGKATVQIRHVFENGSTIKITTEKYYTKGGKEIHEVGVKPNVIYVTLYQFRTNPSDPQVKRAIEMMSN